MHILTLNNINTAYFENNNHNNHIVSNNVLFSVLKYDFTFSKQIILVIMSLFLITFVYYYYLINSSNNIIPSKIHFLGEIIYNFVYKNITESILDKKNAKKFFPILFSFFLFISFNNFYGAIPFMQCSPFAQIGSSYAVALIAYYIWIKAGIKQNGIIGFIKVMVIPSNMPLFSYFLLIPIEILSNFIIRPITHSLRLFATMFSGHLISTVIANGLYFFIKINGILKIGIIFPIIFGIFIYFLEILVMFLQAYVFTLLLSLYINSAISKKH